MDSDPLSCRPPQREGQGVVVPSWPSSSKQPSPPGARERSRDRGSGEGPTITREQAEGLGGALPPGAAGPACGGGPSVLRTRSAFSGWTSGKLLYPDSRESY